jgi:hypothetical protein
MATTCRAVQVSRPGRLEMAERELTVPPPGQVRIVKSRRKETIP